MAEIQGTKTAQYLSREEIRKLATELVDNLTFTLVLSDIPLPDPEELETDEDTIELQQTIEWYIARMQDKTQKSYEVDVPDVPHQSSGPVLVFSR